MMIPVSNYSKAFLKTVPHKPGVYRMISEDEKILYVGKAKDLKNRVSSYFRGNIVNSRTYSMVKQIRDVQVTITATEAEAFGRRRQVRRRLFLGNFFGYLFFRPKKTGQIRRLSVLCACKTADFFNLSGAQVHGDQGPPRAGTAPQYRK